MVAASVPVPGADDVLGVAVPGAGEVAGAADG
jgi:hypothetical protein